MIILTNEDIRNKCIELAKTICVPNEYKTIKIYGVPRGGIPVAYMLAGFLPVAYVVDTPEDADIIVDDIIDSGATKARYAKHEKPFYSLYKNSQEWLVFPWEQKDGETPVMDNLIRVEQYLDDANAEQAEPLIEYMTEIICK